MGIQNRPRITVTVKGELVGDRILRAGTVIYSVLPNPDVPKYDICFFLLQKVGYVYAILNSLAFESAQREVKKRV